MPQLVMILLYYVKKAAQIDKLWFPQSLDLFLGWSTLVVKKQGNSIKVLKSKTPEGDSEVSVHQKEQR